MIDFDGQILIPRGDVGDFAVVACDQFTSQPEYWDELYRTMPAGSALDFVLPECYLRRADEYIERIRQNGKRVFERFDNVCGAVAVTRTTVYGRVRRGIVASVNLDDYDFAPDTSALIRASERTIVERIPPRVAIRKALDIELPHIILLVDDRDGVLRRAADSAEKQPLYDSDLRGRGGHIRGELIRAGQTAALYDAVSGIIESSSARYGTPLFALVGDGNHSLATAKRCHDDMPTAANGRALVEIIDIYDEGLVFEPIHRIAKTDDPKGFVKEFGREVGGEVDAVIYTPEPVTVKVPKDKVEAIKRVDEFCERYAKKHGGETDYVHGKDALRRDGYCGIELRGMEKSELFGYVVDNGVLPKKSFSLGEAEEKRFYIEARGI